MYSGKDPIWAAVILVTTFAVFRLSPFHLLSDSRYQMLFSQQLLWQHTFSVEPAVLPRLPSNKVAYDPHGAYQLLDVGGRFYSIFPPGGFILSIPYVALANVMGLSATNEDGTYNFRGEMRIQAGLAAVLMACLSAVVFVTGRLLLPLGWSLLIAAATAFCTQVWSTASRAVWSHTWGILILAIVVWLLVRTETKRAALSPVLLATCLSWLYFVRPMFVVSIVAITVYILIYYRAALVPLVITGCVWLAISLAWSYYNFGQLLPVYFASQLAGFRSAGSFWEGLAGTLISPARGLLIYLPILLFVIYLLVRYWKNARRNLAILAVTVVSLHLLLISAYPAWHGGHCYGARYSTDVVPWFGLLGILAIEARLRWTTMNQTRNSAFRRRTEWSIALLLLICSVILNGIGATSKGAWYWNAVPTNINEDPKRLWDWRHPPFLGIPDRSDSGSVSAKCSAC